MKTLRILKGTVCLGLAFLLFGCTPEGQEVKKEVLPLPTTISLENVENGEFAVSLSEGAVFKDDAGNVQIKADVYDFERYAAEDVAKLSAGDEILVSGKRVRVEELARTESGVQINGGLDFGGIELYTEDNETFYQSGYNDAKTYYKIGEITLPVAEDFVFADEEDFGAEPIRYTAEDFLDGNIKIQNFFTPHNAMLKVKEGQAAELHRRYVP